MEHEGFEYSPDKKILEDRGKKYGPMREQWTSIEKIQEIMMMSRGPGQTHYGQLAALNMVVVKIMRALYDPTDPDHYADARNYITIAEKCANGNLNDSGCDFEHTEPAGDI